MIKKLMHTTVAVAGLAAILLTGACSHSRLGDTSDTSDQVVQVRPEATGSESSVVPAPGPAVVDSDGNTYSSSSAPGTGNPSTVGTNTNVNIIADRSARTDVVYSEQAPMTTTTTTTQIAEVTPPPAPVITTTTETTTAVPMTSAAQEEPAPVRERLRKD